MADSAEQRQPVGRPGYRPRGGSGAGAARRLRPILDAGTLPGTPSTVVDLSRYGKDGTWQVLREGAVDTRTLARHLDQ